MTEDKFSSGGIFLLMPLPPLCNDVGVSVLDLFFSFMTKEVDSSLGKGTFVELDLVKRSVCITIDGPTMFRVIEQQRRSRMG